MKIGIDLGTYNSSAAIAFGKDKIVMIESRHGKSPYGAGKNFPSFVLFDKLGEKQAVGLPAKRQLADNPELVVWGVKRLVGLSYQTVKERGELQKFQYAIEQGEGGSILIRVGGRKYRPQDILSFILQEIKRDAEDASLNPMTGGRSIEEAMITVPAYFKGIRTNPIVEAAKMAGFHNIDTVVEPIAAALRYGLKIEKEAVVLVFDMGAGTLDVTVMEMMEDPERGNLIPGALCTSGHEALGGIDMDDCLVQYVTRNYEIPSDSRSLSMLREDVERAKCLLSTRDKANCSLPNGDTAMLIRSQVESALESLLEKCRGPIRVALREAKIDAGRIDHVLFVGGPTHMPCVRMLVHRELKQLGARREVLKEIETLQHTGFPVDPMESVSQGAALKAGKIVKDVGASLSEGYGTIFGQNYYQKIIPENSPYPIQGTYSILHGNVAARLIPVPLVSKLADTAKSMKQTVSKFEILGNYFISPSLSGKLPCVDIVIDIRQDKTVTATFIDKQSGESVSYPGLNELDGKECPWLQDTNPPETWDENDIENRHPQTTVWTGQQLEALIHAATAVQGLLHSRLRGACPSDIAALQQKLIMVSQAGAARSQPATDCPSICNAILGLLAVMRHKQLISQQEYDNSISQIQMIAC
ncbi:MAG: Hsp70 family protein [Sedimentisphaerales bacterium]|jgi:molecular chaperone DnaK